MAAPTGAIQNFNSYNSARECTRDYQQFHRSGYGNSVYLKCGNGREKALPLNRFAILYFIYKNI